MNTRSELTHPVRLDRLGNAPLSVVLEPDQAARAALAERFGLQSVDSLRAELTVWRRGGSSWIEVSGRVVAEVVQSCVVTTDPVSASVTAEVRELFDDSGEAAEEEVVLDPLADTPEPVAGDILDVGEIAAQAFGLALDPYPRAPGAVPAAIAAEPAAEAVSPFAKLAALKARTVKKG